MACLSLLYESAMGGTRSDQRNPTGRVPRFTSADEVTKLNAGGLVPKSPE